MQFDRCWTWLEVPWNVTDPTMTGQTQCFLFIKDCQAEYKMSIRTSLQGREDRACVAAESRLYCDPLNTSVPSHLTSESVAIPHLLPETQTRGVIQ